MTLANTNEQGILETTRALVEVCNQMKGVFNNANSALVQNSVDAIDWNNLATDYPNLVDTDGFMVNEKFTPADVSNSVNAISQVQQLYLGNAGTTGPWGELMEKLSKAL